MAFTAVLFRQISFLQKMTMLAGIRKFWKCVYTKTLLNLTLQDGPSLKGLVLINAALVI